MIFVVACVLSIETIRQKGATWEQVQSCCSAMTRKHFGEGGLLHQVMKTIIKSLEEKVFVGSRMVDYDTV